MHKTEEAENEAQPKTLPSVYLQTSVIKAVSTVIATYGGHFSAQARDLRPSVKPIMSTEAAVRDIKRDRTKIDHGACSQTATEQPEVKFATSKMSMTLSTDPYWLPPTFEGFPNGAFHVSQLANTQNQ